MAEPEEPSSKQMQEELKQRLEAEEESQYRAAKEALEKQEGSIYPYLGGQAQTAMDSPSYGLNRRATVRQQMVQQMTELEQRAKEIRNLIKLFDENPNVEQILNTMRRLGIG